MPRKKMPKKSPSHKLILLSILAFSLIYGGFRLYRSLLTPLQVAEVGECPANTDCSIPPVTELKATCQDNNTKATISWNSQVAKFFSLRLDDVSNNQSSCIDSWFCADTTDRLINNYTSTTYTTNITPNTHYHLWLHPSITPDGIPAITGDIRFSCSDYACPKGFTEDFSSNTLDPKKWFYWDDSLGGSSTQKDGKLVITLPADKDNSYGNIGSTNLIPLIGDFTETITLNSLTTTGDSNGASFYLGAFSSHWQNWYRIEIYKSGDIQTYSTTNTTTTPSTPIKAFTHQPTKLKITRSGSTLTTFYDVGSGYQLHSTVSNISTDTLFIQLGIVSHAPDKPAVTATLDNYSLSCPQLASPPPSTPSPKTTLRHSAATCHSLSFSWDKVTGAPDYVIDLADNPNFDNVRSSGIIGSNNDNYTFSDLLENRTYYTRISLGNIHDFPRYTTLPGVSTSSCNTATTPTVAPTPRPTIRPTSTPTNTNQVLYRSSPTPIATPVDYDYPYTEEDIDNMYSDETKPTFFSRLISWFQNLFN